ncbi:hypothetical protein ONZ51_g11215 [Trametes cubensis]|uniref:Methyltransferase domain-containing protein n=1 Tax=Trametes cubensis TaxID=1111947 RepID=A0AAD7X5Z7_9APHY|nr:hypothetical protein ONZ51_g11215 [Trametes cubensis]
MAIPQCSPLHLDTDDRVEEALYLTDDEIALYFELRDGRLWSLSTYPLPVDIFERMRQNEHYALLRIVGLNDRDCLTELQRCLSARTLASNTDIGVPIRALDMGTGNGNWVTTMAEALPEVHFYGIDIGHITGGEYVLRLEFHPSDTRYLGNQVEYYPNLIAEAARILKHGGILSICEWTRSIHINDGSEIMHSAPRACAFLKALGERLDAYGYIGPVLELVKSAVDQEPSLAALHRIFWVPIGDWPANGFVKSVGIRYRQILAGYAIAVTPFLKRDFCAAYVDGLVEGFISDLHRVRGLSTSYYSGYATRT